MGKNKNKALNLSRGEKTVLCLIANLNARSKKFTESTETESATIYIQELKNVLNGKARRIAECILSKTISENDKVRSYADKMIAWADTI